MTETALSSLLPDGGNSVDCLWVTFRWKASRADIMVGFCDRPSSQHEKVGEILYKHLGEDAPSLLVALVGNFNPPDVC